MESDGFLGICEGYMERSFFKLFIQEVEQKYPRSSIFYKGLASLVSTMRKERM